MGLLKQDSTHAAAIGGPADDPADYAALVARLGGADAAVRRSAARALEAFPQSSAVLVARLDEEPAPAVREAIIATLVGQGDLVALTGLTGLLRSEDASLRNEAIEALKRLPDSVAPWISKLLADDDPDVRIFAVNILESLRHPRVERWLIEVIAGDPHVNVCATALDLLGEVGSPASLPALCALPDRFADEPYIRFAVELAVARIGSG